MKRLMKIVAFAAVAAALSGCVNCISRIGGRMSIDETYQSTQIAAAALGVPFYSDVGADIRVIMGIAMPVVAADVVCEAVIDTVLFPIDYLIIVQPYKKSGD